MKVLVVPDVHLKANMFNRASELLRQGIAERAVCLMDIADDWGSENCIGLYKEAYSSAARFAIEHPETLWCYGNHDLSYLWERLESGYSFSAENTVLEGIRKLNKAVPEGNLAYIHKIDDVLFMHGGLKNSFVKRVMQKDEFTLDELVSKINSLDVSYMWNDKSPIWFRPRGGNDDSWNGAFQVVGHTPVQGLEQLGNILMCDNFSTYSDGSNVGTCEYAIIDTVSHEWESIG